MILEQLTLRNFCLFAGEQVFDLRPGRRDERHLPIVLFGGINGGGKTTLLDAIQLALYGVRARCSKRSQREEHLYDVCRSWRVVEGRVREELRVLKDGVPSLWLADNWPQLMEDIFPLDISGLFFFDAEKIRTLAEDETSSKALGAAIKSLLGLDIVERLITGFVRHERAEESRDGGGHRGHPWVIHGSFGKKYP
jgi:DNA sulfur modification protein DndD